MGIFDKKREQQELENELTSKRDFLIKYHSDILGCSVVKVNNMSFDYYIRGDIELSNGDTYTIRSGWASNNYNNNRKLVADLKTLLEELMDGYIIEKIGLEVDEHSEYISLEITFKKEDNFITFSSVA